MFKSYNVTLKGLRRDVIRLKTWRYMA